MDLITTYTTRVLNQQLVPREAIPEFDGAPICELPNEPVSRIRHPAFPRDIRVRRLGYFARVTEFNTTETARLFAGVVSKKLRRLEHNRLHIMPGRAEVFVKRAVNGAGDPLYPLVKLGANTTALLMPKKWRRRLYEWRNR